MYAANKDRYDKMEYRRCGNSGLKLPILSLGFWHNFGSNCNMEECEKIVLTAFDNGITHFDLANNYGPIPGSAELNFGKIFNKNLKNYRDQIIISSKAGYLMWEGPYGEWGSKKYLTASLDQSLARMGLDYVDIFYHHRPDPLTNLEETACALDLLVKQGKALYIGISNYSDIQTKEILKIFKELKTPFIINQPSYNILNRNIENGLTDVLLQEKIGCIVFSPLAQGLLTNRYLNGIPEDSRAKTSIFLNEKNVNDNLEKIKKLNEIAVLRNQTLSQMALSYVLHNKAVTSALVGVSKVSQLLDNLKCQNNLTFTDEEIKNINSII